MKLANIILMMGLGSLFMTLLFMMIASIILGMDFLQVSTFVSRYFSCCAFIGKKTFKNTLDLEFYM
ncbi:hypothetical protein C7R92_17285 [Brevibacillus porteri]|uniref:Uncharacterized protein n=1 Tax=Brevibacillus porteri TaxID=2126350 RepID=A0ABX5FMP5_9BACL|nr:hypothetical protein C7R92_17285 [Brevibacillus porteri]